LALWEKRVKEEMRCDTMATNLNDIQLNEAEKQRLATIADRHGRLWSEVFQDALTKYVEGSDEGEVDLVAEYRELFPDRDAGQKPVTLERMRQLLSQVSESLATDIIADREDRL
jgi:hypothetical protein